MISPSASPSPVVSLRGVSVDLDGHPALRDVDVAAFPGRILAVAGTNGSGKSTLLNVAAGLITPGQGRVERASATSIAFVSQRGPDVSRMPLTVIDLVTMGRWRHLGHWRLGRRHDREIVAEALETVGMTALAHRPASMLSGGQRQRAFLAQALAQRADLLLLDEPMAGLDEASRGRVADAARAAAHAGAAVMAVTHDLAELGAVDEVLQLADGRVASLTRSPG